MKTNHSGISPAYVSAVVALMFLTGCQASNFYHAESMPRSLMLAKQSNPQEVDLSRLASATGGSETIGPGDILDLSISASLNQNDQVTIPVRIGNDGKAIIPDMGAVALGGVEPQAAEALIRMEAINRGLYRNPTVTVSFAHKKMNSVRVLGAVKEPGTYLLTPGASDIVSAIAAAGGLAENAGERVDIRNPAWGTTDRGPAVVGDPQTPYSTVSDGVEVRGGMTSYSVNLASAAVSSTNSYHLQDGGVLMVEKRDPAPVYVQGLVNKPDTYPYPVGKDMTVLGAISLAGGVKNQLADKIFIIRPLANGEPAVIQVSLRRAKRSGKSNIRLGPGDIVSVEQTPSTVFLEMLQLIRIGVNGTAGLF